MHSVRQGPSVDLWYKCVCLKGEQEKPETVKMHWGWSWAELIQISCTSHTHRAKCSQEPTSGWMSSSQFETSLSWILNVLNGFGSFSGWLNWTLRSGILSAVAVQGIIRGGRCLWALPQHQLQRGPASRRRDSLPYTALTFGILGLNKTLRTWNVVTTLQTLKCYTCAGLQ